MNYLYRFKKTILFLLISIIIIPLKINGFSNEIFVYKGENLLQNMSYGIPIQTYSLDSNNSIKGRVICTLAHNHAPYGGQKCSKISWTSDKKTNNAIGVGVANVIHNVRTTGKGSITSKNAVYAFYAINNFLYSKTQIINNNIWIPAAYSSYVDKLIENAKAAFTDYITYYEMDNSKKLVNISNVNIDGNKLTAKIKCKDKNNKNIKCDLYSFKNKSNKSYVEIDGNKVVSNGKDDIILTKNNKDNSVSLTVNMNVAPGNHSIIIVATNRISFPFAQNYYCGWKDGELKQNVTPNATENISIDVIGTYNGNLTQKVSKCNDYLNNYDKNSLDSAGEDLIKSNPEILNYDSPSCDKISPTSNISCDKTNATNVYLLKVGDKYRYCWSTFEIESEILNESFANRGKSLLYKSDNGEIAQATITHNCLLKNRDELDSFDENLFNNNIPKLKISFKDNSEVFVAVDSNSEIIRDETRNMISKNIKARYKYGENHKFYYKNGNIVSDGSSTDNFIGYGFDSTNLSVGKSQEMTYDIDYNGTVFEGSSPSNTKCNYTVDELKADSQILYRTIDVNNPFKKYNGGNRYTGSNWCSENNVVDDIEKFTIDIVYGDVNDDGRISWGDFYSLYHNNVANEKNSDIYLDDIIDSEDYAYLLSYLINNEIKPLSSEYIYIDYNNDGYVNLEDVYTLQKKLSHSIDINCENYICDLNNDGNININDVTFFQRLFPIEVEDDEVINTYYTTMIPVIPEDVNTDNNNENYDEANKCSVVNNPLIEEYITNRPNSNGKIKKDDGTSSSVKPLYSFSLDAKSIKDIRDSTKSISSYLSSSSDDSRRFFSSYVNGEKSSCSTSGRCNIKDIVDKQLGKEVGS